ncbi:MAG: hypothetical protein ABSG05_00835 [Candidatus Pacearchaeota archaeon]|jgi:hypothetical protein
MIPETKYPVFRLTYWSLDEEKAVAFVAADSRINAESLLMQRLEDEGDTLGDVISAREIKYTYHHQQKVLSSGHIDRRDCVVEGYVVRPK